MKTINEKLSLILFSAVFLVVFGCTSSKSEEDEETICSCHEVSEYHSEGLEDSKGELDFKKQYNCSGNLEEAHMYYDGDPIIYFKYEYINDENLIEVREFSTRDDELTSISLVRLTEVSNDIKSPLCLDMFLDVNFKECDICLKEQRVEEVEVFDQNEDMIGDIQFWYDDDWNVTKVIDSKNGWEWIDYYEYNKSGLLSNYETDLVDASNGKVYPQVYGDFIWEDGRISASEYTVFGNPDFEGVHELSYSDGRLTKQMTYTADGFPKYKTIYEYEEIECD